MDFDRTKPSKEAYPDYSAEEFTEVIALRLRRAELEPGSGYINSANYRRLRVADPTEEELHTVRANHLAELEAAIHDARDSEIGRIASK